MRAFEDSVTWVQTSGERAVDGVFHLGKHPGHEELCLPKPREVVQTFFDSKEAEREVVKLGQRLKDFGI